MGGKPSTSLNSEKSQWIKEEISSQCVVIFSKSSCPYCRMAKKIFTDIGQEYKCIELNSRQDGSDIQDILNSMTGARTVPRVFINGKCIGGGDETKELHQSGKLLSMLKECENNS